jgi:Domain of unknown function (DUF4288)
MITNWEELATKLNVLRPDGSESYTFYNSQEALEEILGKEWIRHAVDTFISGGKSNELAIKTLRRLNSRVAAEYAYQIFQANKDIDIQKTRYAIWTMNDILHPICLKYADEFLDDPRFVNQAIWLIKELIYNTHMQYEPTEFNAILLKAENAKSDTQNDDVTETINDLQKFLRQKRHFMVPKYYALVINKIEITNTKPTFGYEEAFVALDANTPADAERMFEDYKSQVGRTYQNAEGEMATISFHKLIEINAFLFNVPNGGFEEIFSRHFDGINAYYQFEPLLNKKKYDGVKS